MGYYKKLDVEAQAEIDSIVRWYNANKDMPEYVLNHILCSKQLLEDVIALWESDGCKDFSLPKPKAVRKVRGRRSTYRKPGVDPATIGAIGIVLSIWILVLTAVTFLGGF